MREAIPPIPQYVFIVQCLVKHWDNFTFPFTFYYMQRTHEEILIKVKRDLNGFHSTYQLMNRLWASKRIVSINMTSGSFHKQRSADCEADNVLQLLRVSLLPCC
jgi:hypothetical protein